MDLIPLLPRRLQHLHRRAQTVGCYPGSLKSALTFVFSYTGLSYLLRWDPLGLQSTYAKILLSGQRTLSSADQFLNHLKVAGLAGLTLWFCLCTLRKLFLRQVLRYHGWMYERGRPSWKTQLYVLTLRLFNGWTLPLSRQLYGLQNIIPSLPVPSARDTVDKYLESMRPLLDEEKFVELTRKGEEFVRNTAPRLQRYLKIKSWFYPNYVSDWWEDYIYLMQRSSLLLNSNYYAIDCLNKTTHDQAARAALMAWRSLRIRQGILRNDLEPLLGQDVIPFCNWQYERSYNTCRIPGESIDSVQHEIQNNYVAVYANGKYWKVKVYRDDHCREMISPAEMQLQFVRCLEDHTDPEKGEERLAALTTWDRPNWARARTNFFSKGVNKKSLDVIEKCAFVVYFDDEEYSMEYANEFSEGGSPLDNFAHKLLTGNGANRWTDKSVILIVGKNGRCGAMGEHSWGDGSVTGHLFELCLAFSMEFTDVDVNGRIKTPIEVEPPFPERLRWDIPGECLDCIDTAYNLARLAIPTIDQRIVGFESFGKGLMKKCKVSPDAFIQMALQLAYYRDQGHFDLTYEPTITRLYLQGRTETVRSCTVESCRWVRSMEDDKISRDTKIKYFQEACGNHQNNFRLAMEGKACDRHLFALYVVSKYLQMDVSFLQEAVSRPWKLSTSQAPFSQIKHETLQWVAAGFATVSPDGYGVSYISLQENLLFFHVSSSVACPKTDSIRFCKAIQRALLDIRDLFFGDNESVPKTN